MTSSGEVPTPDPARTFTLLFASQTGTAESIAEKLEEEAPSHGVWADVYSMDDYLKQGKDIANENIVVIVSSSTGDGDPPDNGAKFYKLLKRRTNPDDWLANVRFTILGLGDTNYSSFNQVPRTFEKRFKDGGAHEFYKRGEADDATGLEAVVEPWVEGLWSAVNAAFLTDRPAIGRKAAKATTEPVDASATDTGASGLTKENPSSIRIVYRDQSVPLPDSDPHHGGAVGLRTSVTELQAIAAQLDAIARAALGRQLIRAHALDSTYCAYSQFSPFQARVTMSRALTSSDAEKTTLHFTLDTSLSPSPIEYLPGDSVAICVPNDLQVVSTIIKQLHLDADAVVCVTGATNFPDASAKTRKRAVKLGRHLQGFMTIEELLRDRLDLNAPPKKLFFKALAEFARDKGERAKLLHFATPTGTADYKAYLSTSQPTVAQVFADFPSVLPKDDEEGPSPILCILAEHLQPQQVRHFSICTSKRSVGAHILEFAITLVDWPGTTRRGLASHFLETLHAAQEPNRVRHLPIFVAPPPAERFRPPDSLSTPMILIGPGTGITPFRSFLQERAARIKQGGGDVGPCILYAGCRDKTKDYLFGDDIDEWVADGTISTLRLAESRSATGSDDDPSLRVYVQHLIREDKDILGPLLASSDIGLFVCGNGSKMSKDVHDALSHVLQRANGMTAADANMHLQSLLESDKYVRDVWH